MAAFTLLTAGFALLLTGCSFGGSQETSNELTQEEIDQMKPCALAAPGNRLDIAAACAAGVCAGDSYTKINQTLGETGHCSASWTPGATGQTLHCSWRQGTIRAAFHDAERDDVPDEGGTMQGVHLAEPWDGADASGLALGLSLRCFLDVLGPPDQVDRTFYSNEPKKVSGLYWDALGLDIDDKEGQRTDLPNGYVESATIGYRHPASDE